jgi:hypothetical protein
VGNLTAIDCGFTIAITDDGLGVDLDKTTVAVVDADGESVSFTRTDNATSGVITIDTESTGTYAATIVAQDNAGNVADAVTKSVTVATCVIDKKCVSFDPSYAMPGETVDVTIKTSDLKLVDGDTVTFSCSDITVNSTTVNSADEVVVNITVAVGAADATCTVTVKDTTTNCEFAISSVVVEDCTNGVDDDGDGAVDCDDSDCAADPACESQCDDTETSCTDGIDNDCDNATDCADSDCADDAACATDVCELTKISRDSTRAPRLFPRVMFVSITGNEDCEFSRSSVVDFGDDNISARVLFAGGNKVYCLVNVKRGVEAGTYDVTVDDAEGVTFEVK